MEYLGRGKGGGEGEGGTFGWLVLDRGRVWREEKKKRKKKPFFWQKKKTNHNFLVTYVSGVLCL